MLNTCTNCGKTITYLPTARLWIHKNSNNSRACIIDGRVQIDKAGGPILAEALEEQEIGA